MMEYETVLPDPKMWQAVGKVERWYEGYYGPEWLHHMHKMIDALVEGQTLDAYVHSVLTKPTAERHKNPPSLLLLCSVGTPVH